jgi:hypothetical protein
LPCFNVKAREKKVYKIDARYSKYLRFWLKNILSNVKYDSYLTLDNDTTDKARSSLDRDELSVCVPNKQGTLNEGERLSTIDLLVLTSLDQRL